MKTKYKKGKCLIEDCPNKDRIYSRGLCVSHYTMMLRTIHQGKHTWEEFEEYGMANKSRYSYIRELFEKTLAKRGSFKKIKFWLRKLS